MFTFMTVKQHTAKFQNDSLISGVTYLQITNIFQCFTAKFYSIQLNSKFDIFLVH